MLHKSCNRNLRALSPFTVGETQILLVPNELNGSEPSVLVVARYRGRTISSQLPPADMRQFAEYLQAAADEAEALTSPRTARDSTSERSSHRFA